MDYNSCHYPDYAVPHCSSEPCGFTCKHGFTPSPYSKPTACVCEPPYTVCNGVCGKFHHCSSQKPKRDAIWRDRTCPHGWSACGVWGQGIDYECVDVTQDLWSCVYSSVVPPSFRCINMPMATCRRRLWPSASAHRPHRHRLHRYPRSPRRVVPL